MLRYVILKKAPEMCQNRYIKELLYQTKHSSRLHLSWCSKLLCIEVSDRQQSNVQKKHIENRSHRDIQAQSP